MVSLVGAAGPSRGKTPSPLVLRLAALCRLALPNFCLKLILKEKKKPGTKKAGSLFYWTLYLLPEAREEGMGERETPPSPSSWVLPRWSGVPRLI